MKEPPIELEVLTRLKNRKWIGDEKADVVVCCNKNYGWSEKVTCDECKRVCFHTPTNLDMQKKKAKMICVECALTKFRDKLNKEQVKLLEMVKE